MKKKKPLPYLFVFDELEGLDIKTKPMFGCLAIYLEEKIVLILRDRESNPEDNGVWLATTGEHHASLSKIFPSVRSIKMFSDPDNPSGWQVLPKDADDFEESAALACKLVRRRDPRIGKVPVRKKPKNRRKKPSKNK